MTELIIKNLPKISLYLLAAIAIFFPYALMSDKWLLPKLIRKVSAFVGAFWRGILSFFNQNISSIVTILSQLHGPKGPTASSVPTRSMVIWVTVVLGATLLVSFFS